MTRRYAILAGGAAVALLLTAAMLTAETRSGEQPVASERIVVKICQWDNNVSSSATDGYKLPAGRWQDLQKQGWKLEQYLVAPASVKGPQGLFAVLVK